MPGQPPKSRCTRCASVDRIAGSSPNAIASPRPMTAIAILPAPDLRPATAGVMALTSTTEKTTIGVAIKSRMPTRSNPMAGPWTFRLASSTCWSSAAEAVASKRLNENLFHSAVFPANIGYN